MEPGVSAALDIEIFADLIAHLRGAGHLAPDESPICTNLAGGVSNRTVLLERANGQSWVLKQALHRLRVAVEWTSDPRRIEREALGIQHLGRLAPPGTITPLVFLDPAQHLLAMQAVPPPHENWKSLLLAGRIEESHLLQFGRLLGTIHRRGWEERATLCEAFADRSFFESLRLEPYYLFTAEQVPAAASFLRQLVATTRATRQTLVHGDYSPKNILVHCGRLVLLDHEVIHFGDGAFDLGFSLAHLLSKARHLPRWREKFSVAATTYWKAYREALGDVCWGDDLEARAVAHTLGCLLARCRGRSPLEYLTAAERDRQADAVVNMMRSPPKKMERLIAEFLPAGEL